MIPLKKELIDVVSSHMFWKKEKTVFFSSYRLPGIIHRFFHKPTLYINGCHKREQFDSICLDYAYQLVEPVVSSGMRVARSVLTLQVQFVI